MNTCFCEILCFFSLSAQKFTFTHSLLEQTHLEGIRSTFAGRITGIHKLYVSRGGDVDFHSSANTALPTDGTNATQVTYTHTTKPGNFSFSWFYIKTNGTVEFTKILNFLVVSTSDVRVSETIADEYSLNKLWSVVQAENIAGNALDTCVAAKCFRLFFQVKINIQLECVVTYSRKNINVTKNILFMKLPENS